MRRQVLVIHGGSTFDTFEKYVSYLKNSEIQIKNLKFKKGWKGNLTEKLGKDFDVLLPQMPNKTSAHFKEWKIWFEKIIPFLENNVILVGHSLGGIFLVKYLSENDISKKIKATILVSAPFDDEKTGRSLADFKLTSPLTKFAEQSGKIYLIQSKDDPEVPFENIEKYKKAFPQAETITFENREHFNQENFLEIIELIKSL